MLQPDRSRLRAAAEGRRQPALSPLSAQLSERVGAGLSRVAGRGHCAGGARSYSEICLHLLNMPFFTLLSYLA